MIVFEDICEKGFVTVNHPPEDYEDSKLIIKRLAKFHAASYYLANEKVYKLQLSMMNQATISIHSP